jgi:virulence-associated protein VapD
VYDLEGYGDNSLAGIVERNVRVNETSNTMEISFCSIPHKDYDTQHSDKIDFSNLEGMDIFVRHFLTPTEKYAFIEQLKQLFARKPRHKVVDAICHDALVSIETYNEIYKTKYDTPITCGQNDKKIPKKPRNLDLMFEIVADNPIMHSKYCFSRRKLIFLMDKKTPQVKKVVELYDRFHENYNKNVDGIIQVLNKIVEKNKQGSFTLKNITSEELQAIIKEVKQTVIIFYVQSIVDYQVLLDAAKDIPDVKLIGE